MAGKTFKIFQLALKVNMGLRQVGNMWNLLIGCSPPVSSTGGPTKKCLIKIPTSFKSQPEVLEKLGKRKGGTGEQSSCP